MTPRRMTASCCRAGLSISKNGKPVKGAFVVVERRLPGLPASILPAWAGASTLTTDSDGRFVVSFPPEQVAERRLAISLQVAHPDFIVEEAVAKALARK